MTHISANPRNIAHLWTGSVVRAPLLVEGVDTTKRINVFLEIGKRAVMAGTSVSQPAAGSEVWIKASSLFKSKLDRPPPVFAPMYAPSGFQNDCVGV
jgi:hypothetical protein